jgi:hypothetical protein
VVVTVIVKPGYNIRSVASIRFRNNEYSAIKSAWLITNLGQEPAKAKLTSQGSELNSKLNSKLYSTKKLVISAC